MKKKIEVVTRCLDKEQFGKYLVPDYPKVVVLNVFDKFWGPCEVADNMIKRFQDDSANQGKVDFISAEKEITGDIFAKYTFGSKPKYFLMIVTYYY